MYDMLEMGTGINFCKCIKCIDVYEITGNISKSAYLCWSVLEEGIVETL
jgi:hypothetical protein